jgi:hypothetical protein
VASSSPYRSLPLDTRLRLVTHELVNDRDARASYIQGMVQKGGGFRPETLRKWPVEQLARAIVTRKLEGFGDELRLLQLLYVELEPELQIAFLDACGVKHEGGSIVGETEGALADEATVRRAAEALVSSQGDRGRHYLRTIAAYNGEAWPGLDAYLKE